MTAKVYVIESPWCTRAGPLLTTWIDESNFLLKNVQWTVSPGETWMLAVRLPTEPELSESEPQLTEVSRQPVVVDSVTV